MGCKCLPPERTPCSAYAARLTCKIPPVNLFSSVAVSFHVNMLRCS